MSSKVVKLTPEALRKIVLEEKEKYEKDVKKAAAKTKEVDADEYAHTLEKEIDHLAVLKIKEAALKKQLDEVRSTRDALVKKLQSKKG